MRMNPFALTAALLLVSTLGAGTAHAGGSVQWQVNIETPGIRWPVHVVVPPPAPLPRVVVAPAYPGRNDRAPRYRDDDADGIPNRYDRVYNPRWDRDGDGIPNRHDAYPNDPRNGHGWHGKKGHKGGHAEDARRQDHGADGRNGWRDGWREGRYERDDRYRR